MCTTAISLSQNRCLILTNTAPLFAQIVLIILYIYYYFYIYFAAILRVCLSVTSSPQYSINLVSRTTGGRRASSAVYPPPPPWPLTPSPTR